MVMALTIAVLVAGSVYLVLQRGLVRVIFGMSLFGHATNLTLLATGVGAWRGEAFPSRVPFEDMADPLPQAFVLTAVVIAMATTTILLMLAALGRDDDTLDNILDAEQAEKIGPGALTTTGRTAYRGVRK